MHLGHVATLRSSPAINRLCWCNTTNTDSKSAGSDPAGSAVVPPGKGMDWCQNWRVAESKDLRQNSNTS